MLNREQPDQRPDCKTLLQKFEQIQEKLLSSNICTGSSDVVSSSSAGNDMHQDLPAIWSNLYGNVAPVRSAPEIESNIN